MDFTDFSDCASVLARAEAAVRRSHARAHLPPMAVMVRSPRGLPMASFELTQPELREFAVAVRPSGFRLLLVDERQRTAEFALDRRAANGTLEHPLRRHGDRPEAPIPVTPRSCHH